MPVVALSSLPSSSPLRQDHLAEGRPGWNHGVDFFIAVDDHFSHHGTRGREGLLQRRSDGEDGRRLQIVLTAPGKRLAESLFEQHTQWISGLFNGLDADERQQLSQLLRKVWQHTDTGWEASA